MSQQAALAWVPRRSFVDCDVVVGEVRETSRKPDEMYSLLERLSPGTRKLEIFARSHNCKPGWVRRSSIRAQGWPA